MKQNILRKWLVAGVLVALQGVSVPAQNWQTNTPSPSESAPPQSTSGASMTPVTVKSGESERPDPGAKDPIQYPSGVDEILKMVQAGVSKEVMKTYIETAQVASHLTAADLVTLKEHGVPDDLTVALMKRGAELAAQAKQASASTEVPAKVSGTMSLNELVALLRSGQPNPGDLDPEGYDYFRHYYLYPRTLASANQRLWSSYPSSVHPVYSFGCWSPRAFRPYSFARQFPGP